MMIKIYNYCYLNKILLKKYHVSSMRYQSSTDMPRFVKNKIGIVTLLGSEIDNEDYF